MPVRVLNVRRCAHAAGGGVIVVGIRARSPSWRVSWFAAAVVSGRPWPDAAKQARIGKSNDYLL